MSKPHGLTGKPSNNRGGKGGRPTESRADANFSMRVNSEFKETVADLAKRCNKSLAEFTQDLWREATITSRYKNR